jgi:hypothetical protein
LTGIPSKGCIHRINKKKNYRKFKKPEVNVTSTDNRNETENMRERERERERENNLLEQPQIQNKIKANES